MRKKEIVFILIVFSLLSSLLTFSLYALYGNAITDVSLTIDANAPEIYILSPKNTTYENNITISYTAYDISLDTVWYTLQGNTKRNSTINSSITLALIPGPYQLILYANDSFGRVNSTDVNFSITQPETPGPPPASGSGSGSDGSSSETQSSLSKKIPLNQTPIQGKKPNESNFLKVNLRLMKSDPFTLELLIDSSSDSIVAIDYEIAGKGVIYKESETVEFNNIIQKQIPLNLKYFSVGIYAISITIHQEELFVTDREYFSIEIENPLKIKRSPWLLIILLILVVVLLAIILILYIMQRKKESGKTAEIPRFNKTITEGGNS